jgi:hypothetical protein
MGGMLGAEGIRKDHQIFVPHPPSTSRSCLMLTSSLVLECSTVVRSRRYQVKHIQRRETKVLEAKLHASYGDLGNLHYPKAKSQKPKKKFINDSRDSNSEGGRRGCVRCGVEAL